jgi:primosomal replication protein N
MPSRKMLLSPQGGGALIGTGAGTIIEVSDVVTGIGNINNGATLTIDYGAGFASNQSSLSTTVAATFVGSKARLSPSGTSHTGGGIWYRTQQSISSWQSNFTFQFPGAISGAEITGLTFVVQNSTSTTNPLAYGINASADANVFNYGAYEHLGGNQIPILNSIAVYFDLGSSQQNCYPISSSGNYNTCGLAVNGGSDGGNGFVPTEDLTPAGIDIHAGNVISCNLVYDGTLLTMVLKDTVTSAQYRKSWPVNIPTACASSNAWVGIGGSNTNTNGATGQEIDILTWQFYEGYNARLATPTFSPTPGQYGSSQTVTLSGPAGATIYYTTNGLAPTSSSTLYAGPFTVGSTEYIQAVAIQTGFTDSLVAVAAYQIGSSNVVNLGSGFSSGDGMILCGNAVRVGSTIQLTDTAHPIETGTTWWGAPVDITSFSTAFSLKFTSANANGLAFVLQNQNQTAATGWNGTYGSCQIHVTGGPNAMGNYQSGMGAGAQQSGTGYIGLYNSVILAFDLFNTPNSVGLYTGGAEPAGSQVSITGGVSLGNSTPISCALTYDGTTLSMLLTQGSNTFSHSWNVNMPSVIGGNDAYAGFTASTGGEQANMFVNSWTFS